MNELLEAWRNRRHIAAVDIQENSMRLLEIKKQRGGIKIVRTYERNWTTEDAHPSQTQIETFRRLVKECPGMEVIYSGLFATPERISQIAEDEDVDAIALSLLNGAHGTLFPRVVKALQKKGIKDVLVVGGGVIPEEDKKDLIKAGVSGVFGPGTPLTPIIKHITSGVSKLRKI